MKHYTPAGNDGKSQGNNYATILKGGVSASIIKAEADNLWTLKVGRDYEGVFVNRRDALEKLRRIAGTRRQN